MEGSRWAPVVGLSIEKKGCGLMCGLEGNVVSDEWERRNL